MMCFVDGLPERPADGTSPQANSRPHKKKAADRAPIRRLVIFPTGRRYFKYVTNQRAAASEEISNGLPEYISK